jgi:serine/threonine-protein kinase
MDYAPGGSLQQRLDAVRRKAEPPLTIENIVRITREVALGLAALHELDAVHRDVKPSNILFSNKSRAMLADLGLAQSPGGPSMRSQMSEAMPHPGTPDYMSPEQLASHAALPPSSDVYALGRVLFEMLTGRQHRAVRPGTPVTKYRADTPEWLVDVLEKMLAQNPLDRPRDGGELAELLAQGKINRTTLIQEEVKSVRRIADEKIQKEIPERGEPNQEAGITQNENKQEHRAAVAQLLTTTQSQSPIWQRIGIELVKIPAGQFLYGEDKKSVYLPDYYLAKTPVTNQQYNAFVEATGHRLPEHWKNGRIPLRKEHHPVVNISWFDAKAFCDWAHLRLPTEQEWEKGARGTDGRKYPWGDQKPETNRCNFDYNVGNKTPINHYPSGASPYGLLDMAGNVWEWCLDWYDNNQKWRVLRGGSWFSKNSDIHSAIRSYNTPRYHYYNIGFRPARSA